MIYIIPHGALNRFSLTGHGVEEYVATSTLANKLVELLEAKGESVWVSRTSPYATYTDAELSRKLYLDKPSLIINIACYSDIDSNVRGFNVECTAYSAFVGTTVLAMKNAGFRPINESGWTVATKSTAAALQELTIYLGYVSNQDDAALMSQSSLFKAAEQIVKLAYAPPVILGQSTPNLLNSDPYLSDDLYAVDAEVSGVPIKAAKSVLVDEVLVLNSTLPNVWIVSAMGSGSVNIIDGAGNEITKVLDGKGTWEKLTGDYFGTGSIRMVGEQNTLFTGLWVAPKGTMGNLDDPVSKYSILPPQYVEAFQFDPTKVTSDIGGNVLTAASSLMERAADMKLPDLKGALEALFQKIDLAQLNPQSFIENVDEFCSQLKAIDLTKIPVIDPNSVNVKYDKIEELLQHVTRIDKRAAIIEATNMMRNVERAVQQQLESVDTDALIQEAKKNADPVVKRLEEIGRRLSKK